MTGYQTNDKGMVNIRDFTEKALRSTIRKSILPSFLSKRIQRMSQKKKLWINENTVTLTILKEGEIWNVYAEDNILDGTFNSYRQATQYLDEEGFSRI